MLTATVGTVQCLSAAMRRAPKVSNAEICICLYRQSDAASIQAALQKRCKLGLGIAVAAYLIATPILREAGLVPPWLLRTALLVRIMSQHSWVAPVPLHHWHDG